MERGRDMGLEGRGVSLVGVGPLASARAARWIRAHVPGVHIPDEIIARLEGAEKQKLEGKRICVEMIQAIRDIKGVAGVHLMAYRQEELVSEIIIESGVLGGRRPHDHHRRTRNALKRSIRPENIKPENIRPEDIRPKSIRPENIRTKP